eukprot:3276223-Amphidinium_carterae.1
MPMGAAGGAVLKGATPCADSVFVPPSSLKHCLLRANEWELLTHGLCIGAVGFATVVALAKWANGSGVTLLGMPSVLIIARIASQQTDQLDQKFPGGWVPNRRFGIAQKSKVGAIDDFAASFVNSTVQVADKIAVESVDQFVGMAKLWYQKAKTLDLPPPFWELSLKTFDLKSAYRQLGVAEASKNVAVILVREPHRVWSVRK